MSRTVQKLLKMPFWQRQPWLILVMMLFYLVFAAVVLFMVWQNIMQGADSTLVFHDILQIVLAPAVILFDLVYNYTDFQGFPNANIFVFLALSAVYSGLIYSLLANGIFEILKRLKK